MLEGNSGGQSRSNFNIALAGLGPHSAIMLQALYSVTELHNSIVKKNSEKFRSPWSAVDHILGQ